MLGELDFNISHADNAQALFVFAHGAGAGKDHEFIVDISKRLLAKKISVIRFNFPYMIKREQDGKRRPPDRMPVLLAHYQNVLKQVDTKLPVFIGGKSMGSRVAATLLSEQKMPQVKGGIALGYPFHPQKKPENLRLTPLQDNQYPILVCQGERDALGNKEEIASYTLSKSVTVEFLEDGDHDLKPRVKSGFTFEQNKNKTVELIVNFIHEHK